MAKEISKSNIIVKRTDEIDYATWQQICYGYEVCFDSRHTPEEFKESFSRSITGYSLHALKYSEDGVLMGHNYYQPRPYILNGKSVTCALSGGTYVLPEYRNDIFMFYDMIKALDKKAAQLGWVAFLGIPNENSFRYSVKIIKTKHIGNLTYYILPVNAGKILKKNSKILDSISRLYASVVSIFNMAVAALWNVKEKVKPLHLDISDKFLDIRFDSKKYKRVSKGEMDGIYRVYDEDGIKTAYILHFVEKNKRSYRSLVFTVRQILKNEKVDAILYVGTMNMPQMLLTKTPKRYEPQQMPLCVSSFDKNNKEVKDVLVSIDNIDFGLINFDVR